MTEPVSRRDFLKLLGLGGVALTVPKPLKVIAASFADLAAPPLHVGYASFPFDDPQCTFFLRGISLQLPHGIRREAYIEFYQRWLFALSFRLKDGTNMLWLKIRPEFLPERPFTNVTSGHPFMCKDMTAECWCVPQRYEDGNLPRNPFPGAKVVLSGWVSQQGKQMIYHTYNDMKTVRLERAEAIRLGLCTKEEPFEEI